MENGNTSRNRFWWILTLLMVGGALLLFACGQESGQPGDLSKKAPPSLGAISSVDGSDEGKKDQKKAQADSEQKPAQSPATGQPPQAAPKQ